MRHSLFFQSDTGFSLIELIMVIVVLSILTVTVVGRWPGGLDEDAAAKELRRALRYAQHMAITQQWTSASAAWGLAVSSNQYTVKRADNSAQETGLEYSNRYLLGNSSMTLSGGPIYFNGLGEPIDTATGNPLAVDTTFTVGSGTTVTVYRKSGYVE